MTSHFDEFQDTNASKAHRLNSGDFDMHKMTKRIQKSHSYFYAHLKSLIECFSILNRAKKEPYNTFKKPKFWNLTIMKSVQFFPLILWCFMFGIKIMLFLKKMDWFWTNIILVHFVASVCTWQMQLQKCFWPIVHTPGKPVLGKRPMRWSYRFWLMVV